MSFGSDDVLSANSASTNRTCGIEDTPTPAPLFDYDLHKATEKHRREILAQMFPERYKPEPEPKYELAHPERRSSDVGV